VKTGWRVGVLVLVLVLAYAGAGRGMRGGGGAGGMRGGMGRGGGMGTGMGTMPMRGPMLTSAVSATGDSIYVLVGTQLMKYDSDLNLVKQVEVKVDYAKMMEEMRSQMPAPPMQPTE